MVPYVDIIGLCYSDQANANYWTWYNFDIIYDKILLLKTGLEKYSSIPIFFSDLFMWDVDAQRRQNYRQQKTLGAFLSRSS